MLNVYVINTRVPGSGSRNFTVAAKTTARARQRAESLFRLAFDVPADATIEMTTLSSTVGMDVAPRATIARMSVG